MSTHNVCSEQNYEKIEFLSENFKFLVVKFSIYLNRRVFVKKMCDSDNRVFRVFGQIQ